MCRRKDISLEENWSTKQYFMHKQVQDCYFKNKSIVPQNEDDFIIQNYDVFSNSNFE